LTDLGFQIAFAVVDYKTRLNLAESDRVEWQVSLDEIKDLQVVNSTPVSVHICDETDYMSFYDTIPADRKIIEKLKQSGALYCMDHS
jgi:hypothetical protein